MKTNAFALVVAALCFSCGEDADTLGVAAECSTNDECDVDDGQRCLMEFKGGYCGIKDCVDDTDCPSLSACVAHDDGNNYCFRTCTDKPECNENRSAEQEANCSSSIDFVQEQPPGIKACVPPSA